MKSLAAPDPTSALSAQLARISPRERMLLGVLALVAVVVAPVMAFDFYQKAETRNVAAREDLSRQMLVLKSVGAAGAGGQAARQREEVRAWSWEAPSAPIARVLAQDRIAAIVASAGITDAEIRGLDKIETAGGVELVKVDIDVPFTWGNLSKLLSGLSETKKGFLVEAMTIQDAAKPRLKMTLKLPTTRPPPAPAA
ncbi:MAG TPA: GspMb/PilO family protein [Caulobacteraceae bacterium]|nr:GspMb/PilO family protein [Caulobacteraceae bacterium]